ncbi:hypothetical protein CXQ82_14700 [Pseudomonas sp. S09G 359]|nr:hypothetical protein CXQ82_14700 [Pseudomonas sp. S09G 359]
MLKRIGHTASELSTAEQADADELAGEAVTASTQQSHGQRPILNDALHDERRGQPLHIGQG